MRAALVRVGVDQAFGRWNGPADPTTKEFVYVPIPDDEAMQPRLETPYESFRSALEEFSETHLCAETSRVLLPDSLASRNMHLDPDFSHLTYGDNGKRRGKAIADFVAGDLVVFYAGLRPCRPSSQRLIYAVIGLYRVAEVVRLNEIDRARWAENAHTRRLLPRADDVIIRAQPTGSGRLRRCLPIGEWRSGAYRVRRDLLDRWGGLSCRDGFIQRSAVPPMFLEPDRFLAWFNAQLPEFIAANNPEGVVAPIIVVVLRQAGVGDQRTDPFYEFGSFGLTGCHSTNILSDAAAAGSRLAFAQGGSSGFRLVMLTPPVDVREFAGCREAFWSPAEMPLRYDAGPLLIDNAGRSDILGMAEQLHDVRRSSWTARFSSAFRGRKRPLPREMGRRITDAWTQATKDGCTRATAYWEALSRRPDDVDVDRRGTYNRWRGQVGALAEK